MGLVRSRVLLAGARGIDASAELDELARARDVVPDDVLPLDRARAELRRVGVRRVATTELSPTELRVATLAASGQTNRAIADALFTSPKTAVPSPVRPDHDRGGC